MRFSVVLLLVVIATPAHAEEEPMVELAVLHSFLGVDIVETTNDARHEHGGPPGALDHASINFEVRDARAHDVSVRKLEIVYANCDKPKRDPKTDVKTLKILGHELYAWDNVDPIAKGKASVMTPAGKPRRFGVNVTFEGITTYAGCAFAIDIVVDRMRKTIELPLQIKRMERLR